MIQLSQRALNFLSTQERNSCTIVKDEIVECFKYNNAPVFEPVIEFQEKYGGYVFYAGLAPIYFGIVKGDGGYPEKSKTAVIEFYEAESELKKYQFICATSDYQMEFTLDEKGRYYEDNKIVASSFDKTVEELAIWNELKALKDFKLLYRDRKFVTQNLDKELNLTLIPEASDMHTLWFKNDSIYMRQRNGLTSLIALENSDTNKKIDSLF